LFNSQNNVGKVTIGLEESTIVKHTIISQKRKARINRNGFSFLQHLKVLKTQFPTDSLPAELIFQYTIRNSNTPKSLSLFFAEKV